MKKLELIYRIMLYVIAITTASWCYEHYGLLYSFVGLFGSYTAIVLTAFTVIIISYWIGSFPKAPLFLQRNLYVAWKAKIEQTLDDNSIHPLVSYPLRALKNWLNRLEGEQNERAKKST